MVTLTACCFFPPRTVLVSQFEKFSDLPDSKRLKPATTRCNLCKSMRTSMPIFLSDSSRQIKTVPKSSRSNTSWHHRPRKGILWKNLSAYFFPRNSPCSSDLPGPCKFQRPQNTMLLKEMRTLSTRFPFPGRNNEQPLSLILCQRTHKGGSTIVESC